MAAAMSRLSRNRIRSAWLFLAASLGLTVLAFRRLQREMRAG